MRETLTVFTANSHRLHYCLSPASCQISGGIRFSERHEPDGTVLARDVGCGLLVRIIPKSSPTSAPPRPMEKLSSTNVVSDAKKFGDH